MKLAVKIAASIAVLAALGFCVAFVAEQVWRDARSFAAGGESPKRTGAAAVLERGELGSADARAGLSRPAAAPGANVDAAALPYIERLVAAGAARGSLLLEATVAELESAQLEAVFVELMARDLESGAALDWAGRTLREIAQRDPIQGMALLYALRPAEREALAASLVRGWVASDPQGAFDWIENAWIDAEGNFIDRALQKELFAEGMETLVSELRRYDEGMAALERVVDPELKTQLRRQVARSVVRDGPEAALERMAAADSAALDSAVMDAIAAEWAARDGAGAMRWTLENEAEVSSVGVRSIAKQLALERMDADLAGFHQGLEAVSKRDAVAAEAARLLARRDPLRSADWALAIEERNAKRLAVLDAIGEIGYDSFGQTVDYVDYVYARTEPDRTPILYTTLKSWVAVDRPAVVEYLISDRAGLPESLSEEILLTQ